MKTYFDTLGIPPGASGGDIYAAYYGIVTKSFPECPTCWSGLRWRDATKILIDAAQAFIVLSHEDNRKQYFNRMVRLGFVCSLCSGKGKIGMGKKDFYGHFTEFIACAACKATGKGIQYES